MNWRAVTCVSGDGVSGYAAVMLWRRVQEARPRASTSGGQSAGWEGSGVEGVREESVEEVEEAGVFMPLLVEVEDVDVDDGDDCDDGCVSFLDMAAHAAKDVHERQLLEFHC